MRIIPYRKSVFILLLSSSTVITAIPLEAGGSFASISSLLDKPEVQGMIILNLLWRCPLIALSLVLELLDLTVTNWQVEEKFLPFEYADTIMITNQQVICTYSC